MYVANNLSIIVFCFVLILLSIQLFISWCSYNIMYNNIQKIYVYKIRCSRQNMHTITVDFPQMNI